MVVKQIVSLLAGGALGFTASLLSIAAAVLLLTGLGGGVLVRERPGTASVINFDPREVVVRAGAIGVAAAVLWLTGLLVFWLGGRDRRRSRPV